jgi:DNA-binding Lrp family transcriptional regulator
MVRDMPQVVAYILMVTDIGKEYDVVKEILKIKGLTEARSVYGEFDVIARIEAEDLKTLDDAVTKIRKITSIIRTVTLISA